MTSLHDLKQYLTEDQVRRIKEDIYNEVLTRNRQGLCRSITPQNHFPLLRQKKVFTRETEEVILAEITSERKAHKFIDELQRIGGVDAYPAFVESIDKTQNHIKADLNKCHGELYEDIPIEILCRHAPELTSRLQSELHHRNIHPRVEEETVQPYVDMARLQEAHESYDELLKGEEPENDDQEENDLIQGDSDDEVNVHDGNQNRF